MNSYDFFDTLCGRGCGEPWRIFEVVGGPAYVELRQEAERQSDKTWAGIFAKVRELSRLPARRVEDLAAAEWEAELAGAFPIAENVDLVRPGDRIVTDTYFSEDQVRQLAARIGIPDGVEFVVSWDDKFTGKYWKTRAAREPAVHVGDNPRSDVQQPTKKGIIARRYVEAPSDYDKAWQKAGLWEVAAAARAARLRNPHAPGTPEHGWWEGAAAANVPFLILAAALVHDYRRLARPERLAFVSRDGILLAQAYEQIYGEPAWVFHASRSTLRKPSEGFLTYVKRLAPGTLFVDLHGTGKSIHEFSTATGVELPVVFVCGQKRLRPYAPAILPLGGIATGTAVEVMNYHDEGRVIDVVGDRPVRAELEYDLEIVKVHRAATLAGLSACCRPPQGVTPAHLAEAAEVVRRIVPAALLRQHEVEHRR